MLEANLREYFLRPSFPSFSPLKSSTVILWICPARLLPSSKVAPKVSQPAVLVLRTIVDRGIVSRSVMYLQTSALVVFRVSVQTVGSVFLQSLPDVLSHAAMVSWRSACRIRATSHLLAARSTPRPAREESTPLGLEKPHGFGL
jgi:hypothetical protein